MVSRYLVDALVIAGLVTGTFGLLYLSQGLLGKLGTAMLRRVLVAAPTAVYFGLSGALVLHATYYNIPPHLSLWAYAAGGFIFGYLMAFTYESGYKEGYEAVQAALHGDRPGRRASPWFRSPSVLILGGMVVNVLVLAYPLAVGVRAGSIGRLEVLLLWPASILLLLWLTSRAFGASERQLQILGLILTLLGIATQFLPPVLDLLGIKIV